MLTDAKMFFPRRIRKALSLESGYRRKQRLSIEFRSVDGK